MQNLISTEPQITMSSLDFLNNIINPSREAAGENPVRPSDFHTRVNDEIGEELNYENFVVGKTGHKTHYTTLTMEQMMLVGMRESKAVRRAVLAKLKELETPKVPQTYPEALRLAADLAEINQKLVTENDSLKNPFKEGMTTTQFCKMLNGVNVQKVNQFLYLHSWLYNESKSGKNLRWRATSYARDRYLTEKQNEFNLHGEEAFIKFQPVLLQKGAKKLYQHYLANELPMKKNWNGLHTHDKFVRVVA
ncbi:phage antirepressor KilAC domain-containing protein [Xenorhabdus doucetiae]|uniref:phage antirepressor KilAC domain-containing protein n=1 Tax=Xenorhabdus doucetiae TaxID=351671 RepID=UPI002B40E534|nr:MULTISPECIES: phage antirepressor KilAC domain-containing protein [unclassified Xenorhabdus]